MFEIISAMRRQKQPPSQDLFDRVDLCLRAGILSIDLNGHLNNANYLKFMDRGRLEHAVVTGLFKQMMDYQCRVVVANTEITYVREVLPFRPFNLQTRLLGWDNKYFYYDQRFTSDKQLHTHALIRTAMTRHKKLITPTEFIQLTDKSHLSPTLPEYVDTWKALLKDKKRYS